MESNNNTSAENTRGEQIFEFGNIAVGEKEVTKTKLDLTRK